MRLLDRLDEWVAECCPQEVFGWMSVCAGTAMVFGAVGVAATRWMLRGVLS